MHCPNVHGAPPVAWIQAVLSECAYTPSDVGSVVLGYSSVLMWLFAQFPQLILNYRTGSADSLSLLFLCNWLLGDLFNLLGAILTRQLPFQVVLATYFVFIDSSLFAQVYCLIQALYYNFWLAKGSIFPTHSQELVDDQQPLLENDQNDSSRLIVLLAFASCCILAMPNAGHSPNAPAIIPLISPHFSKNLAPPDDISLVVGRIFAWACTALYLSSRIPQIYWNSVRRSVEGLSIGMFTFAVLGNLAYTFSLLVKSREPAFLLGALPYLLGTAGTVTFDFIILGQYVVFSN